MVGVPIPSVHAAYFEVFDLSDLDHTLRVLGLTLFVAGVVTTLLGTALGRFASARSLRPLADVSRAAGAIAGGELDTRLDADAADPDLEGLTNSFNAMVDQLQERIEREARFNSDVSHELRSPLTTLAASLEVLEADRDDLPPRSQRALQLLSDDLRRFQRMVARPARDVAGRRRLGRRLPRGGQRLRAGAALGGGGVRPHGRPRPAAPPGGARSTPPCGSWRVGVDKRRFERVMVNLMENADHYGGGATDRRRGAGRRRAGRGDGRRRRARASTPVERTKIFERFYRGSASGRRGTGTGTGLAWPWWPSTCGVMHGDVRVESLRRAAAPASC